jgi:hypothetical protein
MTNPSVGVVVTTYNEGQYIERTLASVFAQRFTDYEVLVVDDGSTDDTPGRLASFGDKIRLIRQPNAGIAGARNSEGCRGCGRTVFVNHNMGAMMQLTRRAIVLPRGSIAFSGPTAEAVEHYAHGRRPTQMVEFDVRNVKRQYEGTREVRIVSLRFDRALAPFEFLEPIRYVIRVRAELSVDRIRASMTVFTSAGSPVGNCFSTEIDGILAGQERDILVSLPPVGLAPGSYHCAVAIGRGNHRTHLVEYDVVQTLFFDVGLDVTKSGSTVVWSPAWGPIVFPDLQIDNFLNERENARTQFVP